MSVVIDDQTYYRTTEVCRILGVSKNTLFRWLKEGVFNDIEYRDWRGWRIFTAAQVETIKTKTKHVTAISRDSQEKFQKMFESVTDGISVIDLNGIITDVNQRTVEMHGFSSKDELLGKSAFELVAPRHHAKIAKNMRQALKQGTIRGVEYTLLRADGSEFPAELSTSVFKDALDNPVGHITIARDITKRKQGEEALRLQRAYFQQLFDSSPDAIALLDNTADRVVQINKGFETLFGYQAKEIKGRSINELIIPEERIEEALTLSRTALNGKVIRKETVRKRKDGRLVDVSVLGYPIHFDNKTVGVYVIYSDITERKQAEEALRESQEFSSSLLENSPNPVFVTNPDTSVRYVNPAFEKVTGFTLTEITGRKAPYPWWPEEQREEMTASFKNAMVTGGRRSERNFQKKNGERFWVMLNSAPVVHKGELIYFLINWLDITERKQTEEALREAEEKYKNLVEATSDMIWEVDETGTFTFVSPRIKDILGYEANEIVGKKTLDLTPKEEARKWLKRFKEINAKRVPFFGFEITHLHKNGNNVVFETSGTPFFDNAGNFKGFVGINKDITERKQAEEKVKQAAEEWRTTFDSITDLVCILDKDFKLARVNKKFADTFGKRPKELVGKNCYQVVHKTDKPITNCPHQKTLQTKRSATVEFFEPSLGIYFEATTSPIFNDKGEVIGSVQVSRDVTERKQIEEQLTITERLASIGELASGIAHELNNPLTSVIGFSQLLMERNPTDDIKEDLGLIYSEAQRAAGIVKNLLTFARKHPPVKQLSQINNVIEDILKLRAYEQKVTNIEVDRHFASDLPEIMIDYFQMQQAFLNIVINAEYFMTQAHNKGRLNITTERLNNTVRISFADDGPGIPKENLSRIFNPFFTTKEVGKGTGLGLSICHGIVTGHGGSMYARSRLGKGATFVVELPINSS